MSKINSAIIFSVLGQYSNQIINFVTIVVLARILTPSEIGIFSVAATTTLIAMEMRSFGITQYLVREAELTEDKIRSVLGLTVSVSWFLGFVIIMSAQAVSEFYSEPALKQILWILSISFFIGPFTSVPVGLWMRNMEFRPIFIRTFVGVIVNSVTSLSLVFLGYSYYGLAFGFVMGIAAELSITLIYKPKGTVWIPSFKGITKLIKFGFYVSMTGIASRFSEGIPDLVIGRFNQMASVGHFSRGLGAILFMKRLLEQAVGPVVLPHLSEVSRKGESVSAAYLKAINLLIAVSWPVMAVASAAAYPMINFLFGDQWDIAVPLASVLALWAILTYAQYFGNCALMATGNEKIMFQISLVTYIFRLIIVVVAASRSVELVAWAMVVSGAFEALVYIWALNKSIHLRLVDLFRVLLPNAFIAACCWGVTKLIDSIIIFEQSSPMFSILVIAPCLIVTWLVLLIVTKHAAMKLILEAVSGVRRRYIAG